MDIKDLGVFTIRVNLEDAFVEGDAIRETYKDVWIELREPSADETMKSQNNNDYAMKLIPSLIVAHNIESGEKEASIQEVAAMIKKSSTLYTHVAQQWGESLPLGRKNPETSETLPDV